MYNIAISLALCVLTTIVLRALVGLNLWLSTILSLVVFTVCYLILTRMVMKKVAALMESAQRDLQAGRAEKAIKTLESGYRYGNWQFYVKAQINAQIGTLLFLRRDFAKAFDYLQKGFVRHWVAMAMLGICYMKRNQTTKMVETFDKAVAANKKEPLLWNLYAYCLERVGDKEKAIQVMEKGLKKVGGDENLSANLQALKDGRRMKMRLYGDLWYQFHLEKPGAVVKEQTKAVMGRRKIVRR
ncbi:TPR repeat-containing protein [Geoalkalibacter ferrihydriticus]|uniref:Uncharacterized protein n=2 Tax=Geoalkalibacter ferrihydriticus TaxID=392333 RepID=A0A0C2HHD0_9BACT|nr:hypothetical protein [Geoalkalibacter ferrihydriticus]KIH76401.1 hypothetical protein GFER_09190 [Geoalkalibacter ferrihydriticus DSM 17813]SDL92636.1 TPR repeat-containing protein [Geoalkalibacter ferrihydriticus]